MINFLDHLSHELISVIRDHTLELINLENITYPKLGVKVANCDCKLDLKSGELNDTQVKLNRNSLNSRISTKVINSWEWTQTKSSLGINTQINTAISQNKKVNPEIHTENTLNSLIVNSETNSKTNPETNPETNSEINSEINLDLLFDFLNNQRKFVIAKEIGPHKDLSYPRYSLLFPFIMEDCLLITDDSSFYINESKTSKTNSKREKEIEKEIRLGVKDVIKNENLTPTFSTYNSKQIFNKFILLDTHSTHELKSVNKENSKFAARIWEIEEDFLLEFKSIFNF